MAGFTKAMISLQILIVTTFIAFVLGGTVPEKLIGAPAAHQEAQNAQDSTMVTRLEPPKMESSTRAKRYIGWGRRPGLRYSKATSDNFDNLFNKLYNKYEKRGQAGPEAPISNFRELRMKQKVPNIQLLLPHLFNRNNRVPSLGTSDVDAGSDLGGLDLESPAARLSDEDVEALMLYLQNYMNNFQANEM